MQSDPRHDGFNYGAPVPAPNYLRTYRAIVAGAKRLRQERGALDKGSWSLDMAIRAVQHACSLDEQDAALETLYKHPLAFSALLLGRPDAFNHGD